MSKIFKSLGFGLGLETIANFWRVSIPESLVTEKKYQFWFQGIWSSKTISVLENLVSEKKSGFQSRFWFRHSVLGR